MIRFAERHAEQARAAGRGESRPARKARAASDRGGLPAGAGPRPARFPGGAAVLLVRPPGRDHRAEYLGRVQPRPPRPAPVSLLPAGTGRRDADPRVGAKSCCSASGSSSTTSPRRPRWASPPRRAAPTPTLPRSTSAALTRGRLGRRQRGHLPAARRDRRDAPAAAQLEHPGQHEEPRRIPQARAARSSAQGWPALGLQRRRDRAGAGAPGQVAGRRARGGSSGCVETGAFGKESYILTGYFNLPKVLEITLHNGVDPRTGSAVGLETGDPARLRQLRRAVRGLRDAAAPLRRHQGPRQRRDRAAVRRATCRRRSCRC